MASFLLTIEASTDLTAGNDPLLEVLVDGVAVSSALITAQTGVGSDILVFTLDYDDALNTYPSSLQLRFNGTSGDGNESVTISSFRINGQALDLSTDFSSDLTAVMLMQGNTVDLSTPSSHDHLFGREDPALADFGSTTSSGTAGVDKIVTGTGTDIIDADGSDDRVEARDGDDVIYGGAGADQLFGQGGNDTILGGAGSDRIWGDNGGDAGDDFLFGQGENDFLFGQAGNDVLNGGSGNDVLNAGEGDDILYGEEGNDRLIGRSGSNVLYGDGGNDIILGGTDDDIAYGGADDDMIHGARGNDTLSGGAGQDTITGGDGVDNINGGADDDTLVGGNGADVLAGGGGADDIYGDAGNDVIEGDDGSDTIDGGAGDDTIDGDDGADTIDGGADNDTINGGLGADILDGGDGNDTINGAGVTNVSEPVFATASDLLSYGGSQDAGGSLIVIEDGDGFILDGNLWKKVLVNYTVTADTVIEFDFKSTLEAEISGIAFDNDDNIQSNRTFKVYGTQNWGLGAFDNYTGSGDWEHYTIDVGSYYTGTFSHLVFVSDDDGGGVDGNSWFRNFQIYDVSNVDDGVNIINGGAGDDILIAGSLGDTIDGGDDDDNITGDAGNDTLIGSDGDDVISGGSGNDTIYAGGVLSTPLATQISDILTANPGVQYYDENTSDNVVGNFYQHVSTNLTWGAALTNAQSTLMNGVAGHLAVITSAGENAFVAGLSSSGDRWIGGSDSAVEGEWRWVGGPDDGNMFWLGASGGSAQNGYYENWNGGEPNDYGSGEDAVEMNNGGGWNDQGESTSQDSIIEWEGSLLLTIADDDTGTTNTLNGNDGDDTINGAEGDDTINGGNNNDTISGAGGDDIINGDDGNDIIDTGSGTNTVNGGAGNDTIDGGDGVDTLNGDGDNDDIEGDLGDDIINGGDGDDILSGDFEFGFVSTVQGWDYDYYDFNSALSNLASAGFTLNGGMDNTNAVTSSGTTSDLDPSLIDSGDEYAIRYETTLTITTAGTYTFQTRSDDGSQLFLDGTMIVDNDGLQSPTTVTSAGQVLSAGTYSLVATYFENGGGNVMEVNMSGPDTGSVMTDLGPYAGANVSNVSGVFGDDVISGGDGQDTLYGGTGADTFIFESLSAFNDIDTIRSFSQTENDVLDISDVLSGLGVNAGNIAQYVEVTAGNGLRVDTTGSSTFGVAQQIASFSDTIDVSNAATMLGNGHLLV